MSRYNTNKDYAFYKWLEQFSKDRPVEPNQAEGYNAECWVELLRYAEDKLREAFDAGYEACKEDISGL